MTTETKAINLLSDGLVIAVVSAFAYCAAFIYEYSYCRHFGIPATLISPSLATLLLTAAAVWGVFASSYGLMLWMGPAILALDKPQYHPYRVPIIYLLGFIGAGIVLQAVYGPSWKGFLVYIGIGLIFFLLMFGPIFLMNREKPIASRFSDEAKTHTQRELLLERLIGRKGMTAFWLGVLTLFLVGLIGDGEASRREQFLTLKGAPDMVVLRNYGEQYIAARFSRESRQLSDELTVFWLSDKKQLEFRNEFIGPLTVPTKEERAMIAKGISPAAKASETSAPKRSP